MSGIMLPMNPPCLINDQPDMVIYGATHGKLLRLALITIAWNFAGLET